MGARRVWGASSQLAGGTLTPGTAREIPRGVVTVSAAVQVAEEPLGPMFDMYSGMYVASADAARQQWGSAGIYIAETSYFNGLARLPEDIASEMGDLYLLRKPWNERSSRFRQYAETRHPHSSRWNWIQSGEWLDGKWVIKDRGFGPYGAVNHTFGSTAKICYYYWRRYEYTQDREWLRTRAYPMLKGAVEFYRHYPNLRKGEDGKYHIHDVNSNEGAYGARERHSGCSRPRLVIWFSKASILSRISSRCL